MALSAINIEFNKFKTYVFNIKSASLTCCSYFLPQWPKLNKSEVHIQIHIPVRSPSHSAPRQLKEKTSMLKNISSIYFYIFKWSNTRHYYNTGCKQESCKLERERKAEDSNW